MENIGKLTRNDNGTVTGHVAETHYDFEIVLGRPNYEGENAPDFCLITKSPRGRELPIGYLWQDKGKQSGETYFRGYIKSSQSGFVRLRLYRSRDLSNVWDVLRKDDQGRRRSRADDATLPEPTAPKRQRKAKTPANETAAAPAGAELQAA
jgi:uncharacterized protein (DUF736 family)